MCENGVAPFLVGRAVAHLCEFLATSGSPAEAVICRHMQDPEQLWDPQEAHAEERRKTSLPLLNEPATAA